MIEQLPSGLLIANTPKETPPPPTVYGFCSQCGKECHEVVPLLGGSIKGFHAANPACRHARYLTCDACYDKRLFPGCPICGCKEDKTS
jgi:hypothetical protein